MKVRTHNNNKTLLLFILGYLCLEVLTVQDNELSQFMGQGVTFAKKKLMEIWQKFSILFQDNKIIGKDLDSKWTSVSVQFSFVYA